MIKEIKVPFLGDGIEKVTIGPWHYQPGAVVPAGEDLLEVEADKALFNIPCEEKALLKSILVSEGQEVAVGETIAVLEIA